ncbi:FecCD family ABC transporter permease [Amorphus sp. 3PC139-8]|uniref:FecCD family ABC transporter permease n=1 Tax=Amorphus sp. 3PC139-8 TaxID=2735676 RepID=UPI00345C80A2
MTESRARTVGPKPQLMPSAERHVVALGVLALVLVATAMWSMTIGPTDISITGIFTALTGFDGSREHLIVTTVRLPRMLAGLVAGSALAVSGAIMQAVTNNPLASPGLLGVNAGAAFAVVATLTFLPDAPTGFHVWAAFAGAAMAATVVYLVGSMGIAGATPVKLALAGAIVSAFVASLTSSVLIFDKTTLDAIRFWSIGSLAGRSLDNIATVAPYVGAGLTLAIVFRRQITTMSLGLSVARTVGQNVGLWRTMAAIMVILLAGGAVAVAGPIGFVGLVVPHVVRLLVGIDYRWILPFCAVGGALLVIGSDAAARAVFPAREIPVGVTMALIGAPFFVYLARYRVGGAR